MRDYPPDTAGDLAVKLGLTKHDGLAWYHGDPMPARVALRMALGWARLQGLVEADGHPSARTAARAAVEARGRGRW